MSALRTLGLERRGRGVSVALRKLIILLLLGSVLGEGRGGGSLTLSSSINSHLHKMKFVLCALFPELTLEDRTQRARGRMGY